MLKTQRMKDNSEIIPYQDPRLPLYVATGKLSLFYNMTPLCHWHDELEYIRPECGCMYYYINGEKILLKEGEAVLINSRQMHAEIFRRYKGLSPSEYRKKNSRTVEQ